MEYITGTREFQIQEPAVVTLGKFDGRHIGHQKLLKRMEKVKAEKGYKTAVFTFDMSPNTFVSGNTQKVITTNLERKNNLEKIGIDYLVEYPFTEETARMDPEEFVKSVLVGQMKAKTIVVGTDCSFGYQGAGNADSLLQWKDRYGYELIIIHKEQDDHRDISSTYIREQLDDGHMEKASKLLGEPYAIHGTVVHGNHIGGAVLGFPTANIMPPPEKYLPRFGVYVSKVFVEGAYYGGVTNLGKKPTVEGDSPVGAETFIFGINEDIYGKTIEVQLLHFIRPEQRFEELEQLKAQIERDREYGIEYLKALSDPQIINL